jgi:hypothetical protein
MNNGDILKYCHYKTAALNANWTTSTGDEDIITLEGMRLAM